MSLHYDRDANPDRNSLERRNNSLVRPKAPSRDRRRRAPPRPPAPDDDLPVELGSDLDRAVNALRRRHPDLSAGTPIWRWQRNVLLAAIPALAALAALALEQAIFVLAALLVFPFFCVVALRTLALRTAILHGKEAREAAKPERATHTGPLPQYSVLVPLHDEAAVVPDLVAALSAIDYPHAALEILLVLEEADLDTQGAVAAEPLPPHVSAIVVPAGLPRTKPRALNFALCRAKGDIIVVYDAEDVPEPDQLRRAATLLATDPRLACVQARLNVLNAEETLLTRQFAIEYTALFDCLLPTLERLGLPVPLGGTSNHFKREVLEEIGGWDPFNVTEDADLGIRLARSGWQVKVLASTTWEEAPATFSIWMKQRTRWLKGWIQTYLVHMRRPAVTARNLGWQSFFGLQVLMGGLILSTLVHPWFYVLATLQLGFGLFGTFHHHALSEIVTAVGITNLILGYVSGVALGCVAVAKRGRPRLALWALAMPVYWLLVSLAAYRAVFQLAVAPYRWEKTRHRPRAAFVPTRD